ncbi:nucleotidyltransferase domain-containing protein [Candidatus Woesearchaeota archaeon]|nr:nucleotidyltransferase domain-containing protein [Candidatus Woesearchaeota archaeon]
MAKKKQKEEYSKDGYESKKAQASDKGPKDAAAAAAQEEEMLKKLPPEVQEKLKAIKQKLDVFQKEVVKKFEDYIVGVALLPPTQPKEGEPAVDKDKINVLVLVDDSDSQKMSKAELKEKLTAIIDKIAQDVDKNFVVQTVILSEIWQSCYDGKYDLLALISVAAPVYDKGMLAAIKIGELHRTMVIKKFEKYIVSYILFGSLTRGEATHESDIDVAIVVDDTDVKKMTRVELKDKLRAIIIGMGLEAGEITGIRNKLNIQVYILTDFWDSIKEANPVIFTILRDGVPLYDRGLFMPWKQLLRMGKIKPSAEAIDMFMSSGEQMIQRVRAKIKGLIEADIYWSTLTPTQAALMLYGIPPPTPKETINLMEEIFVKKEGLLEQKYIDILREIRRYYKEIEHNTLKDVSGKEVDDLLDKADQYLKRVKRLFAQIEKMKEEEGILHVYDTMVTIIRDVLVLEGVERVSDSEISKRFEADLVHSGKVPEKFLRAVNMIAQAKEDYYAKKLSKPDIEKVKKESRELTKFLVEYMQRKRGKELERCRIRVKHGNQYGEVLLLDETAFVIHDIDSEEKEIHKAPIKENGGLGQQVNSTLEELEEHLVKMQIPAKVFIKEPIFEDLKRIFGKDVEVLLNY